MDNSYANSYANPYTVASQSVDVRAQFVRKTYAHLAGAVGAFALIEASLLSIPGIAGTVFGLLGASSYSWLIVMGLFMFASHFANKWAMSSTSLTTQYIGLGVYIVAESLIFLPLLLIAAYHVGADQQFQAVHLSSRVGNVMRGDLASGEGQQRIADPQGAEDTRIVLDHG